MKNSTVAQPYANFIVIKFLIVAWCGNFLLQLILDDFSSFHLHLHDSNDACA